MAKKAEKKNVFVGREKEIDTIKGIIEKEPKANILISGVTGMGKTELCIQIKSLLGEDKLIHCGSYRVESKLEDPVNPFLVALFEVFESITQKEPFKKKLKWFKNVFAKELWKKRKDIGAAVLKDGLGTIVKNLTEKIEVGETSSEVVDILKEASLDWSTTSTLEKLLVENKEAVITTYLGLLRQISEQSPGDHKFLLIFDQVENTSEVFQEFLKSIARNLPDKFYLLFALNHEVKDGVQFLNAHKADLMFFKTKPVELSGLEKSEINQLIDGLRGVYKTPDVVEKVRRLCDGRPLMIIQWINSEDFDLSVIDEEKLSLHGYYADSLKRTGPEARKLAEVLSLLPLPIKGGASDYAGIMGISESECGKLLNELNSKNIFREYPDGCWFAHALIKEYLFHNTDEAIRKSAASKIIRYLERKYKKDTDASRPSDIARVYAELLVFTDDYEACFDRNSRLGRYNYDISGFDTAKRYFERALRGAELLGDRHKAALAVNYLGLIYQTWGKYDQALEHFNRSLPIAQEVGDREGEAAILNNIGDLYRAWGKYYEAIEYFQRSIKIKEEVGDARGKAAPLNNLGAVYASQGKHADAIEHYEKSLKIARETGERQAEGTILNNIASVYRAWSQFDQAIQHYRQALKISEETGNRQGQAVTVNNIGEIYRLWNKYDVAIELFQRSAVIARDVGDRAQEGVALNNIGMIYATQQKLDPAIEYYRKSLAIREEIGDRVGEGVTLNNIAGVYQARGKLDQALSYARTGLRILEDIGAQEAKSAQENLSHIQQATFATQRTHRVFLAHARADREAARHIANEIRTRATDVCFDEFELGADESLAKTVTDAISATDYLVLLLSPNSVSSGWLKEELNATRLKELSARDVTVLPLLLADCRIPPPLASWLSVDLRDDFRDGVNRLVDQLKMVPDIEFSSLSPDSFERLVVDLLRIVGFTAIERDWRVFDTPFYYLKANYSKKDPFGIDATETWVVEIKFYRKSRLDLRSINRFVDYLSNLSEDFKGLLVTDGPITSTVRGRIEATGSQKRIQLRVFDGPDLKRMLLQHGELVNKYFRRRLKGHHE